MLTRFGRRIAAAVVTTGFIVGLLAGPAVGNPPPEGEPPCADPLAYCVVDNTPGVPPKPVPGAPGGAGVPVRSVCVAVVGVLDDVVCPEHPLHGVWDAGRGCWVRVSAGNAHADDPLWKVEFAMAHELGDTLMLCATPASTDGSAVSFSWVWAGELPVVEPEAAALSLFRKVVLRPVEVGASAGVGDAAGVVGVPVWFWAANGADVNVVGPLRVSAAEGGLSVSLDVRVAKTVFDVGDGSAVTCMDLSGVYVPGAGVGPSPVGCDHVYQRMSRGLPGDLYTVVVTTYWDAAWTAGDRSGVLHKTVTSSKQFQIGELQTVIIPGR